MRTSLRILTVAAACALAACEKESVNAPWLTYPGVDGHLRFLPLLGTSHDPSTNASVTCGSCHPGDTFTQPVCTGCHGQAATDGLHTVVSTGQLLASYSWTPPPNPPTVAWQAPSCLVCHPQGGIPDAAHHSFFPVADGTPHSRANLGRATGAFCMACHNDPLDKQNLDTLTCVTCHASAAVQTPLPGNHSSMLTANAYPIVPRPRDCLRCHDDGKVLRVVDHGSKQGPPGFGRAGPWDSDTARCPANSDKHGCPNTPVYCFDCHKGLPPLFGGTGPGLPSRPWAQDWKVPATSAGETGGCVSETATPNAGCCRCHEPKL